MPLDIAQIRLDNALVLFDEFVRTTAQHADAATLREVLAKLGLSDARALMRKGEAEYTDLHLADPSLSQEALIAAMVAHPRLIERPIVINGNQAAIGRPPEQVLAIL